MSSISEKRPPATKKVTSSPAMPKVTFVEVKHERKDTTKNNGKKTKGAENGSSSNCTSCNSALAEVLREYIKSDGFVGNVDDALKKVTEEKF